MTGDHPVPPPDTALDAILIPGGGLLREPDAGSPPGYRLPPWVRARFDHALQIKGNHYLIALSAGTPHKPPALDRAGFPVSECDAGAAYLLEKGVSPHRVLCENASYDTIGNAYFSRVMHVTPRRFHRLLVITSTSHMPRTRAIFQWVYGLQATPRNNPYQLFFAEVPDAGMDAELLQLRIKKETRALKQLSYLTRTIDSLETFHQWFFTEHGAYSPSVAPVRAQGKILNAY